MIIDLINNDLSLSEALKQASDGDTILLDDKTYNEKIYVYKKNITIIGNGSSAISYNDSNATIIPASFGGDGIKTWGTTGSATFTVKEGADGFTAKNVTFINSFDRRKVTKGGQAVAFKSEISNMKIENCKFISQQDTLYVDLGKNNTIINSYIEGDVDFIFGSADCEFINCDIKAVNIHGKAFYLAPDTYIANEKGFVFNNCRFTADDNMELHLGRAWFPGGAIMPVFPIATLIDCKLYGDINMDLIQMHEKDPRTYSLKLINTYLNDNLI